MQADEFKDNLLKNAGVIASSFKRNKHEVQAVLHSLSGDRHQMIRQLFTGLNLPVNEKSMLLLNSIANS